MFDVGKTNPFNNKSLAAEVVPTFHLKKEMRVELFWSKTIHLVVLFCQLHQLLTVLFFNFATELVTIPVKHQSLVRYERQTKRASCEHEREVWNYLAQFDRIFDISLGTSTSWKKKFCTVWWNFWHFVEDEHGFWILHNSTESWTFCEAQAPVLTESCTIGRNLEHFVKDEHQFRQNLVQLGGILNILWSTSTSSDRILYNWTESLTFDWEQA